METTTYPHMTIEHLGSDATEDDLYAFQLACDIVSEENPEWTPGEITEHVWGNGDFIGRVRRIIASPGCPADEIEFVRGYLA